MLRRKIKQGKGRGELGKKYFTKKLAFERGRGVGARTNYEVGINIYTVLYIK